MRKRVITALKVVVSVALIYFIFTKLDFTEVLVAIKKANPIYLVVALLIFIFSKVLTAFRINVYFHQLGILLTQISNFKLYLMGMFYNLFLPGGVGGDAFKGYLIKKKFNVETRKVISVLVLDRLSGLLLLFVYACILAILIQHAVLTAYKLYFGLAMLLGFLVFWVLNKKYFGYVLPIFWKSIAYSALAQLTQLLCVYFILKSLSIELNTLEYLLIFIVSAIFSLISIGGIGSRELAFYYGATFFGLDENVSVGISLIFLFITAVVSLIGIIYHFKKPALETIPN